MFDKYYQQRGKTTEYIPYEKKVTINEHRAPTDESVKLLSEFKEKAKESLIREIIINDNNLEGCILLFNVLYNPYKFEILIRFTINGKEFIFKDYIDEQEYFMMRDKNNYSNLDNSLIKFFFEKLSQTITIKLLEENQKLFLSENMKNII
jgi:type I restriction-modification system DNA methylase subunit